MKIDFNKPVLLIDGRPMLDNPDPEKGKPVLIKVVVINALTAEEEGAEEISGEEKSRRFGIAEKIYSAEGPVELTIEEVALIKQLVGERYPIIIVGRVWSHLEGKS